MAEIPPTPPLENRYVEGFIPAGCNGFMADEIPDVVDVARQTKRVSGIENSIATNPNAVSDREYGEALQLQHMIVSKSVGRGGAPAWAMNLFNMMETRFGRLDLRLDHMDRRLDHMDRRLDHMGGRLDHMDGRLDQINVIILAGHSRSYNFNFYNANLAIQPIVKYIPGHPGPMPPIMANFHFDENRYDLGVLPLVGLVPATREDVMGITLNARIDHIH